MFIRMLSHAINVKQNLHSKNAFSWRYTLFLLMIIRFKTSMRNISANLFSIAEVEGRQTYHAVCLAVPPDWIIEYSKNGNKIQKEY